MNWSAEQQRLLGAMGYELMVRVTPGELLRTGVRGQAAAAVTAAVSAVTAAKVVAPGAAADVALFPALQQALRRAAGDRDIAGLVSDLERLRREPALKRALWPTLRALRRSQ